MRWLGRIVCVLACLGLLVGGPVGALDLRSDEASTSAMLAGILTDETGTGVAVFGTSPALTTSVILGSGDGGTPAAFTMRGAAAAGTNVNALAITITPETGTGTGNAGRLIFNGYPSKETTGTTAHTATTYMTLGATNAAHPGTGGFITSYPAVTVNDEVTAGSGTAALASAHAMLGATFTARNTSVTSTDAQTLYITDSAGGTNNTATNVWSLNTGKTKLRSTVTASALTAASGTPNTICQNDTTKEITVNAALTCTVSARDQKSRITAYPEKALAIIHQLKPSQFVYKDHPKRLRWGFVAEDVAAVNPALADGYVKEAPRSLDMAALLATAMKGIQEQQAQIEALRARLEKLEAR